MAIYCVHQTVAGMYPERTSSYHRSEEAAAAAFNEAKTHVGDDPSLIEITRIDLKILDEVIIGSWEGTIDDIVEESEELCVAAGATCL